MHKYDDGVTKVTPFSYICIMNYFKSNILMNEYTSPQISIIELIIEQEILGGSTTIGDLEIEDLD